MARIVVVDLPLVEWLERLPSTDTARPGRCPSCDAPSRVLGRHLNLVGHGVRDRQLLGPLEPYAPPQEMLITVRRFRCVSCGAVCTVGPRGLVAYARYTSAAMAFALALWASGLTEAQVREQVSPFLVVGLAAADQWASLRRWAANGPVAATLRARARALLDLLLASSAVPADLAALPTRAFSASEHARWWPSPRVHSGSRAPPDKIAPSVVGPLR